ncbi:MAG TPA: hypothetical protein VFR15_19405, partial [Chloroflexia bacterium]|nr:hypothetical protein [Chloroflexia bacterium]
MKEMTIMRTSSRARAGLSFATAAALLLTSAPALTASAQPAGFAHDAFRRSWERTDLLVSQGQVARTWVWGPVAGRSLQEPFREGRNGTHLVQYFDKARMEINDPIADQNNPFFVTNGLLVVEMISGRLQTGVNTFEDSVPSEVRIAGDDGSDAPTYAALQRVASVGLVGLENRAQQVPPGAIIPPVHINRFGELNPVPPGAAAPETIRSAGYVPETGHNIAQLFMDYFNTVGPVYENGRVISGPLFNWVSAFGYPVTEPFWTTIRVGGQDRLILFQAFQRRILT